MVHSQNWAGNHALVRFDWKRLLCSFELQFFRSWELCTLIFRFRMIRKWYSSKWLHCGSFIDSCKLIFILMFRFIRAQQNSARILYSTPHSKQLNYFGAMNTPQWGIFESLPRKFWSWTSLLKSDISTFFFYFTNSQNSQKWKQNSFFGKTLHSVQYSTSVEMWACFPNRILPSYFCILQFL